MVMVARDEVPLGDEIDFDFVCPECGESMAVNASMRTALLDNGCVICSARVNPDAFSSA